jgi:hypothetical protein
MKHCLFIALVLMTGCKIRNELSCDIPGNCGDAGGDAVTACAGDPDCPGTNPFCLDNVCVGCLDSSTCEGSTPVCSATNQCEGCTAHAQCDSQACDFGTGSCFASNEIAYVQAGGTGDCTQAAPCGTLNDAIATPHPVIKFQGTDAITVGVTQSIARDVKILADVGATMTRNTTGPIISISGTTGDNVVVIQDLQLSDALGANGHGIQVADSEVNLTLDRVFLLDNAGFGLLAGNGGKIAVRRAVVSGNDGGGIVLSMARFEVTNTLLVANGGASSTTGGFRASLSAVGSLFHFNTVANNLASNDTTVAQQAGVACAAPVFAASSNIISGNQAEPTCTFDHSLFDTAATGTNVMGSADFVNTSITNKRAPDFYRIGAASNAIDAADPAKNEPLDVDGDSRPQGGARDIGADERAP